MKTPAWWLVLGQNFNKKGAENRTEITGTPAHGAARSALAPHLKRDVVEVTRAQRRRSENGEQLLHKGSAAWRYLLPSWMAYVEKQRYYLF